LTVPAPLPAEVPQSVTGRNQLKEVEEALLNLGNVLTDAYDLAWEGETGEEKYANAQTALAVIRAALAKGVEWERKWAELVETVASRTDQARTMEVKL
jgi:hypothetical protein